MKVEFFFNDCRTKLLKGSICRIPFGLGHMVFPLKKNPFHSIEKMTPSTQSLHPRYEKLMHFLSQFTVRLSIYPTVFPHGGARKMYQKQCVQKLEMAAQQCELTRTVLNDLNEISDDSLSHVLCFC
jgi:hypothetical protein